MTQSGSYWNEVAETFGTDRQSATWRTYMQQCYLGLARTWFAGSPEGRTLKTDLFEEAVTPHHLLSSLGSCVAGMDVSPMVVRRARARLRHEQEQARANDLSSGETHSHAPLLLVADARQLPWADGSMTRILSGSSLDHFDRHDHIRVALAELVRCLATDGCLIVTFDNPHNPIVRLRNALPFGWLSRTGLVPYFVGATYTRDEIVHTLTALGLRVTHTDAMAHVPRAPAIWASDWHAKRAPGVSRRLLRLFTLFDAVLGRSPLRFRTGYYLAVRAVKPATG